MKAIFYTVSFNAHHTKFMQCADVFEKGKVLGRLNKMTVDYKENEKLTIERAAKLITHIKDGLEKGGEKVSMIHLHQIEDNKSIYFNKEFLPYYAPDVLQISDGNKWYMFHDLLSSFGFNVATTKDMYIKSLSF